MAEKQVTKINGYNVVREDSFAGISVWAFHAMGKIYPAFYIGQDREAKKFFFKTKNERFRHTKGDPDIVLVYSEENLNREFFHPMLLDMAKIEAYRNQEGEE